MRPKPLILPLCMNIQRPCLKGWLLVRDVGVPVEARTWAKNSGERICADMLRRFESFQAGRMSRNCPGSGRESYQPMPKPSPFVVEVLCRALRLWSISELSGLRINASR